MIDIKELSEQDLKQKIKNIKTEREKTADALKKYEEELERRKQEIPLGVPYDGKFYVDWKGEVQEDRFERAEDVAYNSFSSYESAEKYAETLLALRKALVANSKGEPIDIQVLLPLLPKGWVAMDRDGSWFWYDVKIDREDIQWTKEQVCFWNLMPFNIKPAENWKNSLMECGL